MIRDFQVAFRDILAAAGKPSLVGPPDFAKYGEGGLVERQLAKSVPIPRPPPPRLPTTDKPQDPGFGANSATSSGPISSAGAVSGSGPITTSGPPTTSGQPAKLGQLAASGSSKNTVSATTTASSVATTLAPAQAADFPASAPPLTTPTDRAIPRKPPITPMHSGPRFRGVMAPLEPPPTFIPLGKLSSLSSPKPQPKPPPIISLIDSDEEARRSTVNSAVCRTKAEDDKSSSTEPANGASLGTSLETSQDTAQQALQSASHSPEPSESDCMSPSSETTGQVPSSGTSLSSRPLEGSSPAEAPQGTSADTEAAIEPFVSDPPETQQFHQYRGRGAGKELLGSYAQLRQKERQAASKATASKTPAARPHQALSDVLRSVFENWPEELGYDGLKAEQANPQQAKKRLDRLAQLYHALDPVKLPEKLSPDKLRRLKRQLVLRAMVAEAQTLYEGRSEPRRVREIKRIQAYLKSHEPPNVPSTAVDAAPPLADQEHSKKSSKRLHKKKRRGSTLTEIDQDTAATLGYFAHAVSERRSAQKVLNEAISRFLKVSGRAIELGQQLGDLARLVESEPEAAEASTMVSVLGSLSKSSGEMHPAKRSKSGFCSTNSRDL